MDVHYYSQYSSLVCFWNIKPFLKENKNIFMLSRYVKILIIKCYNQIFKKQTKESAWHSEYPE